jgi:hypothetical protein
MRTRRFWIADVTLDKGDEAIITPFTFVRGG